ncbi:MAG: peptidylprolyl isomerase, partial [Candidatus Eisenbacteria bacterium]
VRAEAARAILLCGKEKSLDFAPTLLNDDAWFVRAAASEALGETGLPDALAMLRSSYSFEKDNRVRASMITGVGKLTQARALPLLQQASQDSDMVVVVAVCEAFAEIGDARAVGVVRQIYEKWKDYPEPDVKYSALETLKKMKAVNALEVFRESLFDKDFRVRQIAYEAFRELWGPSPAESLRALSLIAFRPPEEAPEGYKVTLKAYTGRVAIVTEKGEIIVRLLGDEAPNTVENFVTLITKGYYKGLSFHRVVPNFVIQDGCPRGDGWGGPGYTIRCEINRRHYLTGTVGMALAGKDTGGSQFFITHSPLPHLDGRYTVFGEVEQGMDVVEKVERGERIIEMRLLD